MTVCPMPMSQYESPRKISARHDCIHRTGRKRDKDLKGKWLFMGWTMSSSTSWDGFRVSQPREYDKEQRFALSGKPFSGMQGLVNRSGEFFRSSIGPGTSWESDRFWIGKRSGNIPRRRNRISSPPLQPSTCYFAEDPWPL